MAHGARHGARYTTHGDIRYSPRNVLCHEIMLSSLNLPLLFFLYFWYVFDGVSPAYTRVYRGWVDGIDRVSFLSKFKSWGEGVTSGLQKGFFYWCGILEILSICLVTVPVSSLVFFLPGRDGFYSLDFRHFFPTCSCFGFMGYCDAYIWQSIEAHRHIYRALCGFSLCYLFFVCLLLRSYILVQLSNSSYYYYYHRYHSY